MAVPLVTQLYMEMGAWDNTAQYQSRTIGNAIAIPVVTHNVQTWRMSNGQAAIGGQPGIDAAWATFGSSGIPSTALQYIFAYRNTPTTTYSLGSPIFDTIPTGGDPMGLFSASTSTFRAPVSGKYQISYTLKFNALSLSGDGSIYIDTTLWQNEMEVPGATTFDKTYVLMGQDYYKTITNIDVIKCAINDTIGFSAFVNSTLIDPVSLQRATVTITKLTDPY